MSKSVDCKKIRAKEKVEIDIRRAPEGGIQHPEGRGKN